MIDWRDIGISPEKIPPAPRYRDHGLIILGGARCVWEDCEKVMPQIRSPSWHVMTVNDIVMHATFHVKHAYSNHADLLEHWVKGRHPPKKSKFGTPMKHTGNNETCGATWWPLPMHGTSSLNAVYVGLMMGYGEIILGGIPLDDSGHYFDPPWVESNFTKEVPEREHGPRFWENAARKVFHGRVRSLSGRTRDLLGSP